MPTFFGKAACIFFAIWGRGLRSTCSHKNSPARMRAAHARAIRLLARSPGIHDLRERVKMATAQPKVANHSCKLFAAGDWRNSLLETERRTGSDKLKWRLAVVSEGSAETRRYILLVGRFWIFRRSAPLWIGPQRCGSKCGCRSAILCTLALRWAPTRQGAGLGGHQVARPAG